MSGDVLRFFFLLKERNVMKKINIDSNQLFTINVVPLKDLVFFPHMVVPLIIGRRQSLEALEASALDESPIFLVAQKDAVKDDINGKDLYRQGVMGRILQSVQLPNGLVKILVEGVARAKVIRYKKTGAHLEVVVELAVTGVEMDDKLEAKMRHLLALFKDYIKMNNDIPEEIMFSVNQIDDVEKLTDFVATYLEIKISEKQKILGKWAVQDRLDHLLALLNKENSVLALKSELEVKVRDQMVKSQRNFYLHEQLRVIRDELGEDEDSDDEISYIRKKISEAKLPEPAHNKAMEELQRLNKIPPLSPEYNVIRTFLDWLASIPWTGQTIDETRIKKARQILDEDHYGLEKPKKRILEYIAVLQRVNKMQGPILCLAGPPGVGKTSLGMSIARALGRKFTRISLGGVHDEAEIRGHRRTYIGSMPGKIIQGIKKIGTINPVFLLDEVDKLGSDYRGDPSSALLEVLDLEQNHSFIDHYLEVEYDLSKVIFVVTANNPNEIPDALLDRMEVIDLPGYLDHEKLEIAKRHLISKQMRLNGLDENELSFTDSSLNEIIINYTMEAGVRSLEREISKICRQAVILLSESKRLKALNITEKNIRKYLGERKYPLSKLRSNGEIGVANGLAWTPYGGDLLRVEVNLMPGKDKVTLTGKLGDIMQESAMIAIAYIRSRFRKFRIDRNFPDKNEMHIHLPEGAVPKDGPSAGITLTSALLSALKKEAYPGHIAMTGEITLRGKILPVGGLNEKLLAARRHGIKTIILPAENRSDVKEMDKQLYTDLDLIYVRDFEQVYEIIFGKKKSV